MSYILDALRKSDAQRRLGQTPDLDTPTPGPGHKPGRPGRRSVKLVIVIGLLLAAAALSGVMLGPMRQWLAERDQSAADAVATDGVESVDAMDPDAGLAVEETAPSQQESRPGRPPSAQRPVPVLSRPAPVSSPRPTQGSDQPVLPAGERERIVETAEEAQRLIEAAQSGAPEQAPVRTAPAPAETAKEEPPPVTTVEPWEPERRDFVRVWELPLSIRRELPTLGLSIHVFSTQTAERFVLINGERRIEGDSLGEGARLAEIRREGAVIEFRDYRFLLEP